MLIQNFLKYKITFSNVSFFKFGMEKRQFKIFGENTFIIELYFNNYYLSDFKKIAK